MREMSASAQQTSTFTVPAGVTVADPVPDPANPTARTADTQAAPTAAPAAAAAAAVNSPAAAYPTWRFAFVGVILLIIATALACSIPHFHLKSTLGEDALVLLSIIALIAGAALVTTCFVRNVLRKL